MKSILFVQKYLFLFTLPFLNPYATAQNKNDITYFDWSIKVQQTVDRAKQGKKQHYKLKNNNDFNIPLPNIEPSCILKKGLMLGSVSRRLICSQFEFNIFCYNGNGKSAYNFRARETKDNKGYLITIYCNPEKVKLSRAERKKKILVL